MYFGVIKKYPKASVAKIFSATTPPPHYIHDSAYRTQRTVSENSHRRGGPLPKSPPPNTTPELRHYPSAVSFSDSHENTARRAPNSTLLGRWESHGEWEMFIPTPRPRPRQSAATLWPPAGPSDHTSLCRVDEVATPAAGAAPVINETTPPPLRALDSRTPLHCATQQQQRSGEPGRSNPLPPVFTSLGLLASRFLHTEDVLCVGMAFRGTFPEDRGLCL
ncbi:hypothetical protein BS47DRAFT_1360701 [Hydnum rufescens UP504]|uniref:Uncharacterized protein n=1 Tax=Hydnum rufescens UP504 TaxID=1448309 RepID=A0A9P6B1H6_9AGAM|nr:hypothetical protein BS47DRAFT_1360701 [Hydnum rufescens UP504]